MTRKICVVSSTRADYGLLRNVMGLIKRDEGLQLQVIATGTHMSPEYDLTYREIEGDGFDIDQKIEILLSSDTSVALTKSMGLALISFSEVIDKIKPDLILVLGDRFEILAVVIAAMMARMPIAHISGGEITEGAYDDAIRHSITKMSHLHFVGANEYYDRVVQLGEQPTNIFQVGGMGVDNISKMSLLDRNDLEKSLGIKFFEKNLLITYHPVTLEKSTSAEDMQELLQALSGLDSTRLIFTMPNADTDSRVLFDMIKDFATKHSNAVVYTSLGYLRYLSCIKYVDGVVGNSSSGLTEVPSFCKGTINVGDRQRGRLKAESVIDCATNKESILNAIKYLYSSDFQSSLSSVSNPYGNGGAAEKIVNVLKNHPLDSIVKKQFYDLNIVLNGTV
jgi:GDP/UDP-N,N'-diacetylbacillosamine 2-epimerase (hydrolysing)